MEENQVKENQVKNLRKQINKTKKVAAMLCMAVMLIGLTGCKKEDPEPEKVEESIVIEFDESIPNVLKMTSREQVMSLSVDEFEKSIRQYMPQWRDWYKIPSDYAVTQDDWKSFQYLYCEMVFGPETDDTFISAPEKFATLVADIDVEEDPEWIYKVPTKTLISDMTAEEFREYYVGFYKYAERDYHTAEELEENAKLLKEALDQKTDVEINQMKWEMANKLSDNIN